MRSHKKRTSLADALETVQRPRLQRRPAVSGQAGGVPAAGPGLPASGEQVVAVLVELLLLMQELEAQVELRDIHIGDIGRKTLAVLVVLVMTEGLLEQIIQETLVTVGQDMQVMTELQAQWLFMQLEI